MEKYIQYNFPKDIKTYFLLILASVITVITITFLLQVSEYAQHTFKQLISKQPLLSFVITPITFLSIVYFIRHNCHFVSGSGIPQLIAAEKSYNKGLRDKLLSFRIAFAKIGFIFLGMLGGAPIGTEGPSIHIGGSIFYGFNQFLQFQRKLLIHAIIAIGGSAGLIVAFNAPIAGLLFVYEELGRELKKQLLILIFAISTLVYFLAILYRGNDPYLLDLSSYHLDYYLIWQLIPLAIVGGVLGGLFSKITLHLIDKVSSVNKTQLILLLVSIGLTIGAFNYLSKGLIAGSGHEETIRLLSLEMLGSEFLIMKYLGTLVSLISNIPGGLFMPSISVGASLGSEAVMLYTDISPQIIMIMAMIAYLSSVIRTPLTATFVILEMTLSINLLIPGLIVAFMANYVSSMVKKETIYAELSRKFGN